MINESCEERLSLLKQMEMKWIVLEHMEVRLMFVTWKRGGQCGTNELYTADTSGPNHVEQLKVGWNG